jgi:glycosyltransferase involved in cell wall biosynthesis
MDYPRELSMSTRIIRKKIGLFLFSDPYGGGAFQYSQSILHAALALPQNEYEVVVACAEDAWQCQLPSNSIKVLQLKRLGLLWRLFSGRLWLLSGIPLSLLRKYSHLLNTAIPKIIKENCALWIFPSQDTWSYLLPVKSLSTIHDLMHRYERRFPEVSGGLNFHKREIHYKNVCRYSQGILVDSEVGKRQVIDSYNVNEEILHVLPYIAPPYVYEKNNVLKNDLEHRLPAKFFFYPAQFWKHKNHEQLVRAAGYLRNKAPDIKIVFAGSQKNAYNEVSSLVLNSSVTDHVIFLGYIPDQDMVSIYRRARALIMPTYFGPTNIPPLEAFALGCPVAISNIYGIPEQVGDAALMFDPSNTHEIADVMYRLWTDDSLCISLSEKGRKRAAHWNNVSFQRRFADIIKLVLKNENH